MKVLGWLIDVEAAYLDGNKPSLIQTFGAGFENVEDAVEAVSKHLKQLDEKVTVRNLQTSQPTGLHLKPGEIRQFVDVV
jgi:hypothetical protein